MPESSRSVGATRALTSPSSAPALSLVEGPSSGVDTPPLSSVAAQQSTTRTVQLELTGRSNAGFWIPFDGSRWYVMDGTVSYAPEQFSVIGTYHDLPVYRKQGGSNREIYIQSVDGGLLARYQRR